ncbi:MAG TPA: hypothetical protein VKB88_29115 [Bryobacteraceae bacterium]|nr:hypothetical protein [Bryobacteraceae bacterium]
MTIFSNETAAGLAQLIDYVYTFAAGAVPGKYPPPFPPGIPAGYTVVALAQAVDDFWGYTNPQYYGLVAKATGQVVVAGRGTSDITEWLIDFEFPLTLLAPITGAGSVEEGFYRVFSPPSFVDPNGNPFDLPTYLTDAIQSNPQVQIIVENYSPGGAIQSVLALTLSCASTSVKNAAMVYTFPSPAPGDGDSATAYNSGAPQTFRIWNPWDLVPSAPPSFPGYSQVADAGVKLAPTISQLEPYDFHSVECNHSLRTSQWLLDSQYPLLSSCEWGADAVAPQMDRPARLQAAAAHMRARQLAEPRN